MEKISLITVLIVVAALAGCGKEDKQKQLMHFEKMEMPTIGSSVPAVEPVAAELKKQEQQKKLMHFEKMPMPTNN